MRSELPTAGREKRDILIDGPNSAGTNQLTLHPRPVNPVPAWSESRGSSVTLESASYALQTHIAIAALLSSSRDETSHSIVSGYA